jgi:hypothetical protein
MSETFLREMGGFAGNILNAKALVTSGSKEISIPNRDSISQRRKDRIMAEY